MDHISWTKLKNEYATTGTTYKALSEKYGISFNSIRKAAQRDKWGEAREEFKKKLTNSVLKKVADKVSSACAANMMRMQVATESATLMIERMMQDDEQFKRHIVSEGCGEGISQTSERMFEKYDTKALKEFTGALKDLTAVIRDVYDLPTVKDQTAMDLAFKRLALEEKRAEGEDIDEIEIVMDGDIRELAE